MTTEEKERSRLVVAGKRADDGHQCTVVVIRERTGYWGVYPHGWGKFGVRLPRDEALKVARAILAGAGVSEAHLAVLAPGRHEELAGALEALAAVVRASAPDGAR
ncbi:MAG: hypothetical protein LC799_23555 [Actinobacteria bacterium]|nr:hypothetical protein [Actinomycetota bacterium]